MIAAVLVGLMLPAGKIGLVAADAAVKGGVIRDGMVTEFSGKDAEIRWKFTATGGIYRARILARATSEKGFGFEVNGHGSNGMFPANPDFRWQDAGLAELTTGQNVAVIKRGWGFYDVKSVEFSPAKITAPKPVSAKLVTAKPTAAAQAIMTRLSQTYGKQTWSGQYGDEDTAIVQQRASRTPAIYGDDFMDSSPSRVEHGAKPGPNLANLVSLAKKGSVITLSWHWNAPSKLKNTPEHPWYKGFYTDATDFDLAVALADTNSTDYKLLIRDMDVIAAQLKQLQAKGVAVLWRPLHEAEGGWFWWGAKGPAPCLKLYRIMFNRFTKTHGLKNLIWVWNSMNPAWYPGDDTVDIVAIDRYPDDRSDALTGDWLDLQSRFNGKKILAVAEFKGAPDVERMARFGVRWAFFVSWTGDLGAKGMNPADLKRIYQSRLVVNRP